MDTTQAVILSALIVLTIVILIVGFQVFLTLHDFRKTLKKLNGVLGDTHYIVSQIKKPIDTAGSLITALGTGAGIAHFLKRITKEGTKHERE